MGARASSIFLFLLESSFTLRCTGFLMANQSFQVVLPGDSITVLYQADVPLIACQIMEYDTGKFYELSDGSNTPTTRQYGYFGDGLARGQCGIFIAETEQDEFYSLYVCRVRSSGSNWHYANSMVLARNSPTMILPVDSGPPTRVAESGSNVVFLYTAASAIERCEFKWPGQDEWVFEGTGLEFKIDTTQLEEGICELTLHEVIDTSSGFVFASILAKEEFMGMVAAHTCVTTFIVKDAPDKPQLKLQDCVRGTEPSCSAGPAHPAPIITWMRGQEPIRRDDEDDGSIGKWVWEYEPRSITQNLNNRMALENEGQEITCTVSHVGLYPNGTLHTSLVIPKDDPLSNVFLFIIYFLIGASTVFLAVAIVVAILVVYKFMMRTWCFIDLPK